MSEKFVFNAPQFVDFCNELKDEDIKNAEAYFGKCFIGNAIHFQVCVLLLLDEDHEQKPDEDEMPNIKQIDSERDMEEEFFSAQPSPCRKYLLY